MTGAIALGLALQVALTAWFGPIIPPLGSRDMSVIRKVIADHHGDVVACYNPELARLPTLTGQITVRFTIAASGEVLAPTLQSSTIGNPRVEQCTVAAVRSWRFPKVEQVGIVIVTLPFVFSPDEPDVPATRHLRDTETKLLPGTNGAGSVSVVYTEPTVFLHRSTNAQKIPSNGLVVVTPSGGLLLVDTAWTEAETEAILKWGEGGLRRPWLGAVITHDHEDRAGGIAALERRHIPIAALDLTVAKLEKRGVRGVTTLLAARDGARNDERGFEAFFPGPGHAPDNIVLRFPSLVFGGCLVKSLEAEDLGFTGDADLKGWPEAIRKVQARYGAPRLVPGHGLIDPTGAALQHTLDLLAAKK